MMLILPLLAVALAVPPKRSTSGLGIFVAILIVVAYHKVNQYGQQTGADGRFNPIVALWVPLLDLRGDDLLDVPRPRAQARRAADRRARAASSPRLARFVRSLLPSREARARHDQPRFFPSRRLAFYMVRLFLTRSLAVLFALVLVLMMLDLLGEAGKILADPGNGDAELWHYVALAPAPCSSRASCPSRSCSAP